MDIRHVLMSALQSADVLCAAIEHTFRVSGSATAEVLSREMSGMAERSAAVCHSARDWNGLYLEARLYRCSRDNRENNGGSFQVLWQSDQQFQALMKLYVLYPAAQTFDLVLLDVVFQQLCDVLDRDLCRALGQL